MLSCPVRRPITTPDCVLLQTNVSCVKSRLAPFLGAFVKLRKATVSFVMFVLQSVRTEQLGSHRTHLIEIRIVDVLT